MVEAKENVKLLEELPRLLRRLLDEAEARPEVRAVRPSAGGFSLTEQICHLRDLEQQGYLVRIRAMLRQDRPQLAEFDGAKVARESNYLAQNPEAAWIAFDTARGESLSLLAPLTEAELNRSGRFGTFGMITIRQLIDMMIEHDASHTQELEELRREWPQR